MNNREGRARIAQETLAILANGSYCNATGSEVSIARELEASVSGTLHYSGDQLAALATHVNQRPRYQTTFEVRNESTFAAARRLAQAGRRDLLCLNFASAKNPGGGFLGGSEAQEENLAKSSGLYPCIVQMTDFYEANRAFGSCIYRDDMIYSPGVPVFRDDHYQLLDAPVATAIVTAPAVNRGAVARNEPERLAEADAAMTARIGMMLALALHHGHRTLVLGAWGCGVFANEPGDMARWFGNHLLRGAYRDAFEHVGFAVLDTKNTGTFAAFKVQFGGTQKIESATP